MASSLVHDVPATGPAAHALVIGVGDYPHLFGGSGELFANHDGMGQLSSSPVSARMFAEWLLGEAGYHNPAVPLSSVRLLLSEKKRLLRGAGKFKNPASGETQAVPEATLEEVRTAVRDWARSVHQNEDNLGIFFFSGHGVMVGLEQILLLSDFGDPDGFNARGSAIRFNMLRNGMSRIAARQQFYFLDACRAYTPAFADGQGAKGDGIIDPDPSLRYSRNAAQPVFNATLEGASAFGREGEPSLFTDALLKALKGGGTDNRLPPYDWRIEVGPLNEAIEFLVRRRALMEGLGQVQIPSGEGLVSGSLGRLRGQPLVPVALYCAPDSATNLAQFLCSPTEIWKHGMPDPLVEFGSRTFEAKFQQGFTNGSFQIEVRPPYRMIEIPVTQAGP